MITQISEEQALKMLKGDWPDHAKMYGPVQASYLKWWKDEGYIKKSKLDEAREYADKIIKDSDIYDLPVCIKAVKDKYEQAMKERTNE